MFSETLVRSESHLYFFPIHFFHCGGKLRDLDSQVKLLYGWDLFINEVRFCTAAVIMVVILVFVIKVVFYMVIGYSANMMPSIYSLYVLHH